MSGWGIRGVVYTVKTFGRVKRLGNACEESSHGGHVIVRVSARAACTC